MATDLSKKLIDLGFTSNEARIYLLLLENGLSTAGLLIKKTSFHRNVVYTALDKLISRKLVTEFEQGGVKHYKALEPKRILKDILDQKNKAEDIIPDLEKMRKAKGAEVMIYEGPDGFRSAHEQSLDEVKAGGLVCVMGVRADFYKYMGEDYKKLDNLRHRKKIKLKVIGFFSARGELQVERALSETKYLKDDYPSPVATSIYGDSVLIQVYSEPTIVIRIKSKEVSESYQKYFELLWRLAK